MLKMGWIVCMYKDEFSFGWREPWYLFLSRVYKQSLYGYQLLRKSVLQIINLMLKAKTNLKYKSDLKARV